jgi:hypothetical protein
MPLGDRGFFVGKIKNKRRMAYIPTRSSYTGPSRNIGGSSEYHIDLKMLESLPLAEKVKAFDSLANQYSSIGREIEFSNQAVAGKRYSTALPMDQRVNLLTQAASAHAPRSGWSAFDYYVPFKGKSRFDKGAVEGASSISLVSQEEKYEGERQVIMGFIQSLLIQVGKYFLK